MIKEARPNVFWLHSPDGGEVYFLRTNAGLVMFDSSFLRHKDTILADMRSMGLDPRQIRMCFITHLHCDHVGGVGWWQKEFGFPVVAHELAADPIEKADPVATGAYMEYTGFDERFVPCKVTQRVRGGETLTLGDRTFEIIHAPGHSVGSIHILSGDLLFVGDTVFANGGIGWMDVHWGSHPEDCVETLRRMRPHIGKLALAGHGEPYILTEAILKIASDAAAFYIPGAHGMGSPRAPSLYGLARGEIRSDPAK
jgi:hydroxyacylglutathione hydrolase